MKSVLNKRVLVLNKLWTAVNVCTLQRAISLLFAEKAKIIDSEFSTYTWNDWARLKPKDGEETIRSISEIIKIPEVILLLQYDRLPNNQSVKFSRRIIYQRDLGICQYCGKPVGNEGSIDHVKPRSAGGLTTWTNCVTSCLKCNLKKGSKTLKEAKLSLLKEPKKPNFAALKPEKKHYPRSWDQFISEMFWNVELINDN